MSTGEYRITCFAESRSISDSVILHVYAEVDHAILPEENTGHLNDILEVLRTDGAKVILTSEKHFLQRIETIRSHEEVIGLLKKQPWIERIDIWEPEKLLQTIEMTGWEPEKLPQTIDPEEDKLEIEIKRPVRETRVYTKKLA